MKADKVTHKLTFIQLNVSKQQGNHKPLQGADKCIRL